MQRTLTIGIIGDYDPELRYHQATQEALNHAAAELSIIMTIEWISTQSLAYGLCQVSTAAERFGLLS